MLGAFHPKEKCPFSNLTVYIGIRMLFSCKHCLFPKSFHSMSVTLQIMYSGSDWLVLYMIAGLDPL